MAAQQDHFIEGLEKMSKRIQDMKIIRKEIHCDVWFLNKIKKESWGGCAPIDIPIETSPSGSVKMGECLPEDPAKGSFEKGECKDIGSIWGSLCLDAKSLRCYGQVGKESYVSLLRDQLPALSRKMIKTVDRMIINDGTITQVTANPMDYDGQDAGSIVAGTADGCLFVRCPDELCLKEELEISSVSLPTPIKVYVNAIDCTSHKITFQTNKPDGTAPVLADLSVFEDVTTDEVFIRSCGYAESEACGELFGSIESCLFKGDTLYGVRRDQVPQFQSQCYDLSEKINPANALSLVFKLMYRHMDRCSAKDSLELLVPYRFFAVIAQELQHQKQYDNSDHPKAFYGYTSVCIVTPRGQIKITAVPKMPEDRIWCLDFSTWKWMGDTGTNDIEGPAGQPKWHRERGCTYRYYRDIQFKGKLICKMPKNNFKINIGNSYDDC